MITMIKNAALMMLLALAGLARASSEPPPLIGSFARVTLPAADGPMCRPESPEDEAARLGPPILPDRMGVLLEAPPSEAERAFIDQATRACDDLRGGVVSASDPFQALALLRLEDDLGVPAEAHGILVAAWCVETAMKARPSTGKHFLGDWQDGVARAAGSFQLHENVWYSTCAGTKNAPHDLLWAASCWWSQVLKTEEKARRVARCDDADMLRVAEAAASNVRRYGWRCDSKSQHWVMLERIRNTPGVAAAR